MTRKEYLKYHTAHQSKLGAAYLNMFCCGVMAAMAVDQMTAGRPIACAVSCALLIANVLFPIAFYVRQDHIAAKAMEAICGP